MYFPREVGRLGMNGSSYQRLKESVPVTSITAKMERLHTRRDQQRASRGDVDRENHIANISQCACHPVQPQLDPPARRPSSGGRDRQVSPRVGRGTRRIAAGRPWIVSKRWKDLHKIYMIQTLDTHRHTNPPRHRHPLDFLDRKMSVRVRNAEI